MKSHVKMMWDYDAFPLWLENEHESTPASTAFYLRRSAIDVQSAKHHDSKPRDWKRVPEDLYSDLQQWSNARTEHALRDKTSGPFLAQWDQQGRELWRRVQAALGSDYIVGYFNESSGQVEWPTS